MVKNRQKQNNSHLIDHFPTNFGVSEVSEQTSERSGARAQGEQGGGSKQANQRASDTVLQSVFLVFLDHSVNHIIKKSP